MTTNEFGTWTYNPNSKMTEFTPPSNQVSAQPASSSSITIPSINFGNSNGNGSFGVMPKTENKIQSSNSNGKSKSQNNAVSYSNTTVTPRPVPPPPGPPNTAALEAARRAEKQRRAAIAQAAKDFDEYIGIVDMTGRQSAGNAAKTYANNLIGSGFSPTAGGVVAAQSRLPFMQQVGDLKNQKNAIVLDASNKADVIAAQVAQALAQVNLGYVNTLADYNIRSAGITTQTDQFNASQALSEKDLAQRKDLELARIASQFALDDRNRRGASTGSGEPTGAYDPGYITNAGPIRPGSGVFNPKIGQLFATT